MKRKEVKYVALKCVKEESEGYPKDSSAVDPFVRS